VIIGILGGGQLARMMALAGHPMGHRFVFLDPAPDACAAALGELLVAPYDDQNALARLAQKVDVVTFDFENVPATSLAFLAQQIPVFPPPAALQAAQDRLVEKNLFRQLGISTADYMAVATRDDLTQAVAHLGLPAILKTRTAGYDGKGQWLLRNQIDVTNAWSELAGRAAILEAFIAFEREVSAVGVRGQSGETLFYPLAENTHRDGVLFQTLNTTDDPMQTRAEQQTSLLLNALSYVGVIAVEFFQVGDNLLANEFAPRVHNSGHWTIEGTETSQFENHLRAVTGQPLGQTFARGHFAMLNLIGSMPEAQAVLAIPGAHLHDYGKAPRPGRKIGHVTVHCGDRTPAVPDSLLDLL